MYTLRRICNKIYEWRHPDEPWLSQGAVRFCARTLKPDMQGFEWGSGRSTGWFAQRVQHLTSIEHNAQWYETVATRLAQRQVDNVAYHFIPLDHPVNQPHGAELHPYPKYVAAIQPFADLSLDLIVIDGHYRMACVLAALAKVRRGGYLLIGNTDWMPFSQWGVPTREWRIVHQSQNVMTETTIWQKL